MDAKRQATAFGDVPKLDLVVPVFLGARDDSKTFTPKLLANRLGTRIHVRIAGTRKLDELAILRRGERLHVQRRDAA